MLCLLLALGTISAGIGIADFVKNEAARQTHDHAHSQFSTTFVDTSGKTHLVLTIRGAYDPDESVANTVARHCAELTEMERSFK